MPAVQLLPLGGMGSVTQNMFAYVYEDDILIVDCGIGFPDMQMPGVDVLIPDTRFLHQLLEEGKTIVGMVLTHGHDDHIAATPYILPELPTFPIFASALTAGFAENRMADGGLKRTITIPKDRQWTRVSDAFSILAIPVTHSVPDTRHYAIKTPEGIIYHGADFKLDKSPVDGVVSDEQTIAKLGDEGILLTLIDCLRVEKREWVPSESTVGPVLARALQETKGKVVVTLMSSHIHRIQQTVDAAVKDGRKVVFVGRSVEQNVDVALRLHKLHVPQGIVVDKRDIRQVPDSKLCVIIAGSQGQEGSSLVRAVYGDHPVISITQDDKVIFSADAIPGNEIPYFDAIDELSRNRVEVIYPDVEPDIHESGHASAPEQQHLLELTKSKYVMPIGGADRHRVKFISYVAEPAGYAPNQVVLPVHGEVVEIEDGKVNFGARLQFQPRIVDGLGVGDVGPRVLSDRRVLGSAGMIVLLIPRAKGKLDLRKITVLSRGFVFMQEAGEVVSFIKEQTATIIANMPPKTKDEELKKAVERKLGRKLFKVIRREPMIMVEFLSVD